MKVKIKKLSPDAVIPTYAKEGDAGMDLTAIAIEETADYIQYHTGIAVDIPNGFAGFIFPRSSITKMGLLLKNSVGVIDSGYRGELLIRFHDIPYYKRAEYKVGDRVAQLIVLPIPPVEWQEVEELSYSDRGEGGFGSTDIKECRLPIEGKIYEDSPYKINTPSGKFNEYVK